MDPQQVLDICIAYEDGYKAGEHSLPSDVNEYESDTAEHYAWIFGHSNALTKNLIDKEIGLHN